jgi:hypothetical protein
MLNVFNIIVNFGFWLWDCLLVLLLFVVDAWNDWLLLLLGAFIFSRVFQ